MGISCRSSDAVFPPAPNAVNVIVTEYVFDYHKDIGRGRAVLNVTNEGKEVHGLTLLPLPDDFPLIDEQLRSDVRRPLTPKADVQVSIGSTATLAVDLTPGRYAFVCFVRSPDGVPHSLKGMSSEFRVK